MKGRSRSRERYTSMGGEGDGRRECMDLRFTLLVGIGFWPESLWTAQWLNGTELILGQYKQCSPIGPHALEGPHTTDLLSHRAASNHCWDRRFQLWNKDSNVLCNLRLSHWICACNRSQAEYRLIYCNKMQRFQWGAALPSSSGPQIVCERAGSKYNK